VSAKETGRQKLLKIKEVQKTEKREERWSVKGRGVRQKAAPREAISAPGRLSGGQEKEKVEKKKERGQEKEGPKCRGTLPKVSWSTNRRPQKDSERPGAGHHINFNRHAHSR